ncbi:MAG: Ldh family oxidoreductase [Chloroflexota bacterium]
MADNEVRVSEQSLREFAEQVFVRCGLSREDAAIEVDCLLWANLRGVDSHGVLRIPSYVERTRKGSMNPKPNIKVLKETPAILMLDADLAFGPVVAVLAMKKTMEKARKVGIGWCLVRNATHVGALGYYSLMAAREGMAGLVVVSSPPNMAPYGAKAAGIHNSPISIAVPALRHRPLILDMATSVVAGGKVSLAVDKGVPIPLGWGLDIEGNPTTDPHQATVLLPMGGPKGSGLAVMFECLASVMAGMPLQEPVLRTRQSAWRGSSARPVQNVLV